MTTAPTGLPGGSPKRGRIDGTLLFFIVLAVVSATLVLVLKGHGALGKAFWNAFTLMLTVAPMIVLGLLLGGIVKEIADPRKVAPLLGAQSGWRGLWLAAALGALTPSGPFAAFPIVYALFLAGADIGAVIAYLTAWSLMGIQRIIVWELPLLGPEFALVRVLVSLPLPILAAALARRLAHGRLAIAVPGAETAPMPEPQTSVGEMAHTAAANRSDPAESGRDRR